MINELAKAAHANQVNKGFVEPGTIRNFGECIALVHSELSEALEGMREGQIEPNAGEKIMITKDLAVGNAESYQKFKKTPGFELADAVIRILGMVEEHGIEDFEWYIRTKMAYNTTREYKHGKQL